MKEIFKTSKLVMSGKDNTYSYTNLANSALVTAFNLGLKFYDVLSLTRRMNFNVSSLSSRTLEIDSSHCRMS